MSDIANYGSIDVCVAEREPLVLRLQAYIILADKLYKERKALTANNNAAEVTIDAGK